MDQFFKMRIFPINFKQVYGKTVGFFILFNLIFQGSVMAEEGMRKMKYSHRTTEEAIRWQTELRTEFARLLNISDLISGQKIPELAAMEISSEEKGNYLLREMEINSTPGRRIKVIVTVPLNSKKPAPAVICIAGHGGKIRSVHDGTGIYKGFAAELASLGFVTITTVVSQHEIYEKGRTLMGERLWDLMRCIDYLESLPQVDKSRIGCAGLSLGGEMAMWLGAMDTRIKATLSSGYLTVMDQMEKNHCMCWKFPGLRELVDWADVYSMIAPRPLLCQNGFKEPANDFTVPLAKKAMAEIEPVYADFGKKKNVQLVAHEGAHEIDLESLLRFFQKKL